MPPGSPPGAPGRAGGNTPGPEIYPPQQQPHASPMAGYPVQGYPGVSAAQGTPGPSPAQPPPGGMGAPIPPPGQAQGKTLLGAAAPVGLPNYANYTPQAVSAQQPVAYPGYPQPGQNPSQPSMAMPGTPSAQGMMAQGMPPGQGMGMHGMPPGQLGSMPPGGMPPGQLGSMPPGMPGQMPGQPHHLLPPMGPQPGFPGMGPAPALESALPPEGRRRSSIMRDVAIGVAIAAIVLGGFLAVKFLVLDAEEEVPATALADLLITMPGIDRADLYIDNIRHASVQDNLKIQVPAGPHDVKIVGPGDQQCRKEITLVAGEVTTIECNMKAEADPGSGSGSAAAGSASTGTGSAGAGSAGTQVATGDDTAKAADPAADQAAADKAAADKAAAEKAAAEKAAADKAAADKAAAAEKAAADKAAADKAKADKAAADKAKAAADKAKLPGDKTRPKDKLPPEDNPADRAMATPSKGWVQLTSKPSAKILVNGADTGLSTPITGRMLPLPAGRHRITFQIGGDKYTFVVIVKSGETVSLDKVLQ